MNKIEELKKEIEELQHQYYEVLNLLNFSRLDIIELRQQLMEVKYGKKDI